MLFAAFPDRDYVVLSGSTLEFTNVETLRSNSSNSLNLWIIDDNIAEPCESFICALQGGAVDRVRGVELNQVKVIGFVMMMVSTNSICTVHIV